MKAFEIGEDFARQLLRRLGERDEAALRELHSLLGRRIYLFALNRLRDADTAESVMVDTLYEVWQHPDRFRGDSRLSTWVLGIAKYKILSALRSRPVEHEDISDYEERIEDDAPSVLTELEARQRAELIQRCLQSLNDAQRECLHLVFFEELPLAEVARLQSVPEGTVKTRLFHGRRNLRACVERHAAG